MLRIVVSAGGTGGHIYPALAIINKLKEKDKNLEVLYIGTTDRMEADIVPKLGYRKNPFKNIKVLTSFVRGVKKAKREIKKFRPDIVLGIGGYITLPVVLAAHSLGIKTFIHEQNSIPGLSNKILNRVADKIGVSLESSIKYFDSKKVIFTGNPRSEEACKAAKVNKSEFNLSKDKKLVLIVMGSLGSATINNSMKEILPAFKDKNYEVLFVTGKNYYDYYREMKIPKNVKLVPFLDNMLGVLKSSDLIVSRAGASTIAEITALGLPSILVPSPYVTHNHQVENALVLERANASKIIYENEFSKDKLLSEIDNILNDKKKYDIMCDSNRKLGITNSATKISEIIINLVNGD